MKVFTSKLTLAVALITLFVFFAVILLNAYNSKANISQQKTYGDAFAGAVSCKPCHKDIYETNIHTAHYLTSRPAAKQFIKGSFDSAKNIYAYNKFMNVEMDNEGDSFYQTALVNGLPFETESFDIVVGSGRKGQTYLYWNKDKLFQLPVSYYTALNSWCNSPGYPPGISKFNRQIDAQCLECHSTYANAVATAESGTIFNKNVTVYGIECERCHGPAAQHVAYFTAHPKDTVAKFIMNAKYLNRQQRLDGCALCHSGLRKETKPPFSFEVGDKLDDFSTPNYNTDSTAMLDVHGNQYGLLISSRCFKNAHQMDCSSCHNVHVNEAGNMQTFSQRCMNCHNETTHITCTFKELDRSILNSNCISCHMPLLPSKKIFLQLADKEKSTPDFVRTHKIAIYMKETKEYLDKLKTSTGK